MCLFKKDFFDVINKFKLEDIISIDETSVSTSLTHNYCRAFLGERCVKKTTNNEVTIASILLDKIFRFR